MPSRRRRADAERNDRRVLDATRLAIAELGPNVPVDSIAERAGVGVGTLYRRYPTKEALLQQVCMDAVEIVRAEAARALDAGNGDAWHAVERFVRRCVEQRIGVLGVVAGMFVPSPELVEAADAAERTVAALIARAHDMGAVRSDVNGLDVLRLVAVHSRGDDPTRGSDRALRISLDGLRTVTAAPLPGSMPDWNDERERWIGPARSTASSRDSNSAARRASAEGAEG